MKLYIISERRGIRKLKPPCFFQAIGITYGLGLLWYYSQPRTLRADSSCTVELCLGTRSAMRLATNEA